MRKLLLALLFVLCGLSPAQRQAVELDTLSTAEQAITKIGPSLWLDSNTVNDGLENQVVGSEDLTTAGGFSGVRTTVAALTIKTSTTGNNTYYANAVLPITAGVTYTLSVDVKKIDYDYAYFYLYDGTTAKYAWFDINTGSPGTVQAPATSAVVSAGVNGYRCSIIWTAGATSATGQIAIGLTNADNVS